MMYINEIKTILTDKKLFKYVYYFEYNLERYISMCSRQQWAHELCMSQLFKKINSYKTIFRCCPA